MSFRLMQACIDMREPEGSRLTVHEFAVLLVICRHADDRGLNSRPGEKRLARSARVRENSLPGFVRRLEEGGWIFVARRPGRVNLYTVNVAQIQRYQPEGTPHTSVGGADELSTTPHRSVGAEKLSTPPQYCGCTPHSTVGAPPTEAWEEETIEEDNKKTLTTREPAAGTPPASPPESVSQPLNFLVESQSVSPRAAVPASPQAAAPAQAESSSSGPAATPATARPVPAAPRAPRSACVERIDPNFVPKAIPLPTPPPSPSAPAAVPTGVDEGNRRALAALMEAVAARKIREASAPPPPPPPRPQHVLPQPEWLPCPRQAVLAAWDSILARELGPVPPGSDQMVESFWRTMCRRSQAANGEEGMQAVRRYLQTVADTPFCVGKAPGTRFRATARWVMDEGRINDVCTGRYAPRESS